jgi:hypothetical protein
MRLEGFVPKGEPDFVVREMCYERTKTLLV